MAQVARLALGLLLASSASAQSKSLELSASLSRLDHRDDNASRSIYGGMLTGLRFSYQSSTPRAQIRTGVDVAQGTLSAERGGAQSVSLGGASVAYLRRLNGSISAGAQLSGQGQLIEHQYAAGPSETFLSGVVALRPEVMVQLGGPRGTQLSLAATLAGLSFRPYSRAKGGNLGDPAFVGPGEYRDVTLAVERSAGIGGRQFWRFGYELTARAFDAENGYAAVRNAFYVTSAIRLGRQP